jgi:hypothetical protein
MEVAHLSLHKLVKEFCLSGHDLGQIWRDWWRLLGTAGLIGSKTLRSSTSSSHHPAEDSEGKWNEMNDSDSSKDWKSDGYLEYLTNTTTRPLMILY